MNLNIHGNGTESLMISLNGLVNQLTCLCKLFIGLFQLNEYQDSVVHRDLDVHLLLNDYSSKFLLLLQLHL